MSNPPGRKPCLIRAAWMLRYDLTERQMRHDGHLHDDLLCQLSHCRSDAARRLILGISEKEAT